ncbi:MAG: inorganic pyrophosphatase [Bacteroidia bacterium]|nr:inorganic pyrophosphatase [Bacteroidia bacterium]
MKPQQFKLHPWHGLSPGEKCPELVTVYIEIVPGDSVKYEIDKVSGYLKVDRPQKFSNNVPALYGFIPKTYCGEETAAFARLKSGKNVTKGDGDPLDICVLTEKHINNGDIILEAIPIGGLRMIDKDEADDKIIAVLKQDEIYGNYKDINDCPEALINRLKHYFLTYKALPGEPNAVGISNVYGKEEALEVIRKSMIDYNNTYSS